MIFYDFYRVRIPPSPKVREFNKVPGQLGLEAGYKIEGFIVSKTVLHIKGLCLLVCLETQLTSGIIDVNHPLETPNVTTLDNIS